MWGQAVNFTYALPAALLGSAAAVVVIQPQVIALSVAEVSNIAQEITVFIDGRNPGSGVILSKKGKTYYILTAKHVLDRGGDFDAVTPDGRRHKIDVRTIQALPDVDLAIAQFSSRQKYQTATLANYELATAEQFAFVSGWAVRDRNIPERRRLFSFGKIIPQNSRHLFSAAPFGEGSEGYELLYTNLTHRGTSGGPILDAGGRVIGIHGRAEGAVIYNEEDEFTAGESPLKIGFSLGIPISTFLQRVPQAGIQLSLKIESFPPSPISPLEIGNLYFESFNVPDASNPDPIYWAEQGNQMLRVGQLAQAIAAYDRAIALAPDFYQAWYGKGLTFAYWKKYPEAIAAYNRAIELVAIQLQTQPDPQERATLQRVGDNLLKLRGNLPQYFEEITPSPALSPIFENPAPPSGTERQELLW